MGTRHILAGLCVALMGSAAQATVIHSLENPGVYTTQVAGAHTVNFNDGSCGAHATVLRRRSDRYRHVRSYTRRLTASSIPTLP